MDRRFSSCEQQLPRRVWKHGNSLHWYGGPLNPLVPVAEKSCRDLNIIYIFYYNIELMIYWNALPINNTDTV